MASTNVMLKMCSGLIDTTDVDERENKFLKDMMDMTQEGMRPDRMSGPQVDWLERIYNKHFSG